MNSEVTRILDEARDYPALAISPARAAEIATEVADLKRACAEATARFPREDPDAFVEALRRNSG